MEKKLIYVHGKGGSAEMAAHFQPFFADCDCVGMDYRAQTPWEAMREFPAWFDEQTRGASSVTLIASSLGAYFSLCALADKPIDCALLISPVVNMERLILDMMIWAGTNEEELREKKRIPTEFGETLDWDYLCYVRQHPIAWHTPTRILCGEKDHMISLATMTDSARSLNAPLTVMPDGEHWFHTEEQMTFLDRWIMDSIGQ